jgi:hypothetical protein
MISFSSPEQFQAWQVNRCRTPDQKSQFLHFYNNTFKRGEEYLEAKYNLNAGVTRYIHHIFYTTARTDNYLNNPELLNLIQGRHYIVLEINSKRRYTMATFYTRENTISLTINLKEPTTIVNQGRGLTKLFDLSHRH